MQPRATFGLSSAGATRHAAAMTQRLASVARAAALAAVMAGGARAETIVPPAEFKDYAEGYTLYFEQDGEFAGAETFGPQGRVTWQTPQGGCIDGLWRSYDDELCFYYGVGDAVECWNVLRDEEGLKVRSLGRGQAEPGLTYRITHRDRQPLLCGGPGVQTRAPGAPVSLPGPRPARR